MFILSISYYLVLKKNQCVIVLTFQFFPIIVHKALFLKEIDLV